MDAKAMAFQPTIFETTKTSLRLLLLRPQFDLSQAQRNVKSSETTTTMHNSTKSCKFTARVDDEDRWHGDKILRQIA